MTGQTTSPLVESGAGHVTAANARQEWRSYVQFLKRPVLQQRPVPRVDGIMGTLRMFGLDLIVMIAILSVLFAVIGTGIELPENLNSTLELNLTTVLLVVAVAPFLEELVFRSWLTGRPRVLISVAVLITSGVIAAAVFANTDGTDAPSVPGLIILGGSGAAVITAMLFWKRETPAWFRAVFPALFWLSSAAFALVHLLNYTEGALWVLLPLVVPQFILGTMAAYVRVQYGLIAAIGLHAAHNGFAISVAALAMAAGLEN